MQFEPRFCSNVFTVLKAKVQELSKVHRLAILCFDEMSIKTALEYDRQRDVVDGFANDGITRSGKLAREALVLMVKGLCR